MNNNLSVDIFYGMLVSGAKQVIVNEIGLNQLNVFPVADRDTGTNLAVMMRYIVDNLSRTNNINDLLKQLSQHGLIGSAGNSGLIFSQFFYGLTMTQLRENAFIKINDLASMLQNGYKSAYDSVSNPQPGTILTVMDQFTRSVAEFANNTKCNIVDCFNVALEKARIALLDSKNQLGILKANNVVDAGAQGFFYFIDGMQKFLIANEAERQQIISVQCDYNPDLSFNFEFENVTECPKYKYCYETVIRTSAIDQLESNTHIFDDFGDSLVVGRGNDMLKIHIHTNTPDLLTEKLSNYGEILHQKIDNMLLQFNIASNMDRKKIAIITDTMADLPLSWFDINSVSLIPIQVKINNSAYLDKHSINYDQVLNYIQDDSVTIGTSAPSAAIVLRNLQFLEQFYESFIIIPVAKSLSSTYDVIVNQSRKLANKKISVIDSCVTSGAQGLLVLYANQLVNDGYSHDEIVTKLNDAKKNTNMLVVFDSLDGVIRSGRLPKSMGFFARMLGLRPIVQLKEDGKPRIVGASFTKSGAWKKMLKIVKQLKIEGKVKSLSIAHSANSDQINEFSKYIEKTCDIRPLYDAEISAATGVYVARGSLSIAYTSVELKL